MNTEIRNRINALTDIIREPYSDPSDELAMADVIGKTMLSGFREMLDV